jgi:hypothetical protein
MANDQPGLCATQYFTWSNPIQVGNFQLNQTRALATGPGLNQPTRGMSSLHFMVENHSAGAVPVILIVEWVADDNNLFMVDECVIEQGLLVAGVRRSTVLPTEFGPISDSRTGVGCSVILPCLAHFYNLFIYTDAAPGNPQVVSVAVEARDSGVDRQAIV